MLPEKFKRVNKGASGDQKGVNRADSVIERCEQV